MREFIESLGKDGLKSAYQLLEKFSLYLTIALAVILAIAYIIVRFTAKDKLKSFYKLALGTVIGYALTLTACISLFMIARLSVKGEMDVNFYLMLIFFALAFIFAVALMITSTMSKKTFTITSYIGIGILAVYGIVLLFVLPTIGSDYAPLSNAGMYISSFALVIITALLTIFFGKDEGSASQTKAISYGGVAIALSFALSYVKLFSLPQGGSVTLASMLPLIIYAYMFGARKGVLAGVVYGLLQCLQSPQIYQPMQVLIDYPIAFGVLGIAGIANKFKFTTSHLVKFIIGASIATVLRYVAHFISGYFVFSSWAMEGYTALSWSLVYNLYVIAELAIILFVGVIIFASKSFTNQIMKVNPVIETENNTSEILEQTKNDTEIVDSKENLNI